ncbi:hypothetical protein [Nonomuraea longicatena]|uniref:Uncharacterized protein n=1 Tax=Nonomuraea longicatena TaxID=83682 RepID=A0ABP3ZCN2_9ACTN
MPAFDGAARVLVVDYAERWDTADLLTLLRDSRLPGRLPVRVLLLARPAGTWWQSLAGRMRRDLQLVPSSRELGPLEQEEGITRGGLFDAARDRFAELRQVPSPDAVLPPPAVERHEAYQLVLAVHMAAVLARACGQAPPADPVEVSAFLLARERDHWEAMHARRDNPVATSPDAMAQIVYTATVTGWLDYDVGTAAIERAAVASREHSGSCSKSTRCVTRPQSCRTDLSGWHRRTRARLACWSRCIPTGWGRTSSPCPPRA